MMQPAQDRQRRDVADRLRAREVRTHLSLNKDAPVFRRAQALRSIMALPVLGGLHHHGTEFSIGGSHNR